MYDKYIRDRNLRDNHCGEIGKEIGNCFGKTWKKIWGR